MNVFIGNLPASGKLVELNALIEGLRLHSRFDVFSGLDCFDQHYHYVVVQTDTAEQGMALIQRLNDQDFHGSPLSVREFVVRKQGCHGQAWTGVERRVK